MSQWSKDELQRINGSDELQIAAVRDDGTMRDGRPIWVVRVGDDLFVRAAYGRGSGWHQVARASGRARITAGGVQKDVAVKGADESLLDEVDDAYRTKYARHASIVESITDAEHRATTLQLVPTGDA